MVIKEFGRSLRLSNGDVIKIGNGRRLNNEKSLLDIIYRLKPDYPSVVGDVAVSGKDVFIRKKGESFEYINEPTPYILAMPYSSKRKLFYNAIHRALSDIVDFLKLDFPYVGLVQPSITTLGHRDEIPWTWSYYHELEEQRIIRFESAIMIYGHWANLAKIQTDYPEITLDGKIRDWEHGMIINPLASAYHPDSEKEFTPIMHTFVEWCITGAEAGYKWGLNEKDVYTTLMRGLQFLYTKFTGVNIPTSQLFLEEAFKNFVAEIYKSEKIICDGKNLVVTKKDFIPKDFSEVIKKAYEDIVRCYISNPDVILIAKSVIDSGGSIEQLDERLGMLDITDIRNEREHDFRVSSTIRATIYKANTLSRQIPADEVSSMLWYSLTDREIPFKEPTGPIKHYGSRRRIIT